MTMDISVTPAPWHDISAEFEIWGMGSADGFSQDDLTQGFQEVAKRMGRNLIAIIYTGDRLNYRILALVEKRG